MTADWINEARALGEDAGRAAGSWAADGNSEPAACRRLLGMLADGDPEAFDRLPAPNLSGEWADAPTPRSLYEEITGRDAHCDATWNADSYHALSEALCEAWEEGVAITYIPTCERELRAMS
jgi:hypothetical protein